MRSLWIYAAAFSLFTFLRDGPVPAQEIEVVSETGVQETILGDSLANEPGRWKSKMVQTLVPGTNRLEMREYQAFDFEPERDLDFLWQPSDDAPGRSGKISGRGRLVWRDHGRFAWDADGVVKSYTGDMWHCKPEGAGELVTREGLIYSGAWRDGRPDGDGTLQLPSGESYTGKFQAGFADGQGEFVDNTGERFKGAFHKGLREGRGRTRLPSGFSYSSAWMAGKEEPGSQRIRLAQLGGSQMGASGNDIRLGVTVQRKPDLPDGVDVRDVLTYSATPTAEEIRVAPASANIVEAWKGSGEIQTDEINHFVRYGIFSYDQKYINSTVPKFLLDLQNRTGNTLDISAIRLDVSESRVDNQPAIQMVILIDKECGTDYATTFHFENYGWSSAHDVKLDYAFVGSGTRQGETEPTGSFGLGDIAGRKTVNFDRELERNGVNVGRLKQVSKWKYGAPDSGFPCPSGDLNRCLDSLRANPIFGTVGRQLFLDGSNIMLRAKGSIQYTWTDDRSEIHSRKSPFLVPLDLGHFVQALECGEGAAPEPIAVNPVRLKLSGNDYTLPVPFHKTIGAGQIVRLTVRVDAEKSSTHRFQFVAVLYNGAEVRSRPISLLFYRPRPLPALPPGPQ
jgi:hypothetical protein